MEDKKVEKQKGRIVTHGLNTFNPTATPVEDFSSTFEVKKVPSSFLSYPKNATISYRPYYFGEIKQISGSKIGFLKKAEINLAGIKTSFPKENLTLSDFLYICLLRRISSFGNVDFQITVICPKCRNIYKHVMKAMDIQFSELKAPALPVIAPLSKGELHFNPPTIGRYLELWEKDLQKDEVAILASMCINKPYEEVFELINFAKQEDNALIDMVDEVVSHGLELIPVKCNNTVKKVDQEGNQLDKEEVCGHSFNIDIEAEDILITPFREYVDTIKSKLRYGITSSHSTP